MNKDILKKLALKELAKREDEIIPDVLQSAFLEQKKFINDPSKRKAACSSRRAGKSSAVGLYLVNECIKNRDANCLYVSRTKESAENIMWNDIIDTILKEYKINAKPGTSKLQIKFDNGSILYLAGADANEKQMRNLVGKKYRLVVIDECQNFTNDLGMLVNKVLIPTLGDLDATIALIGTPGNNMTDTSFWYKVATGRESGWSLHTWHWSQNPHVKDNIQKQVNEMLEANPLIAKTPWFRMEYNNEWVPEADARVYHSSEANYIDELPANLLKGASYILSIDLGYHDATAFVIGVYNKYFDNNLYIIESFKKTKLTITAVADIIKELKKKYHFKFHVVDAANTQAVQEMRIIHNLPLIAAEKQGKEAHIALLNSDFITENVKILKSTNEELIKELSTLIWDQKAILKGAHKEDATKENHLCDSLLYNHHASRHFWYSPKEDADIDDNEKFERSIDKHFGIDQKHKVKHLKKPWWSEVE